MAQTLLDHVYGPQTTSTSSELRLHRRSRVFPHNLRRRSPLAFGQSAGAERVGDELFGTAADYAFAVIAYCLMPDHLHALIEGVTPDSFRRFVSMFKQRSAFEYKRAQKRRLWQEGYYDRALRDDEPSLGVSAYILNNPIRAGLCATIAQYPFSGSQRYTLDELSDAI